MRQTTRNLITPKEAMARQEYQAEQFKAAQEAETRLIALELGRICSLRGYEYLKDIADEYLSVYKCVPMVGDPKWETYSILKAFRDAIFSKADLLADKAQTPIVTPIKKHANSRRTRK